MKSAVLSTDVISLKDNKEVPILGDTYDKSKKNPLTALDQEYF